MRETMTIKNTLLFHICTRFIVMIGLLSSSMHISYAMMQPENYQETLNNFAQSFTNAIAAINNQEADSARKNLEEAKQHFKTIEVNYAQARNTSSLRQKINALSALIEGKQTAINNEFIEVFNKKLIETEEILRTVEKKTCNQAVEDQKNVLKNTEEITKKKLKPYNYV